MKQHVLQSQLWSRFKNLYGTSSDIVDGVLYTMHKIPLTNYYYAYSPRVEPKTINYEALEKALGEKMCIAIHFDVPNVVKGSSEFGEAEQVLKDRCVISTRDEFAKGNFLLDLKKDEDDILKNMYKKHRYNIKYARKKGVTVRESTADKDFEAFYKMYRDTSDRQRYYSRMKTYVKKLWDVFREEDKATLMVAEYKGITLATWMLLNHEGVLYYPYGGSSDKHRNLHASCLVGWEAIKFGKKIGCELFDMWGAAENMDNTFDPYYGFSLFKSKFGGEHVVYIDSYDFVFNMPVYKLFVTANDIRWRFLNLLK